MGIQDSDSDVTHFKFKHAIIATGSTAIPLPDTEFKKGGRIMSSTGALALPDIPKTLLVVGADRWAWNWNRSTPAWATK